MDLSPADAGYTHPQDEPPPRRHWVCSGPGKQVFLLRNVSPPPGLAAACSLHLAPLSAVSALCSFPPVRYRHCPQDRGSPSLPTPEWPALRVLRLLWCWCPPVPAGPAWRLSSGPVSPQGQQWAQPVLGSGHPCWHWLMPRGAYLGLSPGLLLPPFSFGPLKK